MSTKVIKAKRTGRFCSLLFVATGITVIVGCKNKATPDSNSVSSDASTSSADSAITPGNPSAQSPQRAKSGGIGSIIADPNPIRVCDGSDLGVANLSWKFSGAKLVEVRVGFPDGGLLAHAGGDGTKSTGKWVGAGSLFYLQDVSNGLPLTAANTIAKVTVNVTTQGCP